MIDPLFRYERLIKHLPAVSDPVLVTLKAHLLAEEILDDLIALHCRDYEALKGVELSFFVKYKLAQALIGDSLPNGIKLPERSWVMIEALNELRNDLAHKLESKKLEKRLRKFLATTGKDVPDNADFAHVSGLLYAAVSFAIGYLSSLEYMVKTGEFPPELKDEA